MHTLKIRGSNKTVKLTDKDFKAQGGEGAIYIVGDVVYKVCDPHKMIPEAKIKELSVLDHARIIKPEDVLVDKHDQPVGYTMRLVPGNAVPLGQILTRTYRDREGVTPEMMRDLVKQIDEGLRSIHKHQGYLQVDGNEFNYMVTGDHKQIYFIDTNSYQTPSFPADAIMPSIRDYSCQKDAKTGLFQWTQLTDWYSFAIISWYMLTGIHPFKEIHPNFPNKKTAMVEQMTAGVSVLDPQATFPLAAVYHPFEDVIPGGASGAYMQWYRAIFVDKKRLPAPVDFQAKLAFIAKVKEIIGSNNFDIIELRKFMSEIISCHSSKGLDVVITKDSVYCNNQPTPRPEGKFRIGFTHTNTPVMAWLDGNKLKLKSLYNGEDIQCQLQGRDIMSCEGRLYLLGEHDVSEIDFIEQKVSMALGRWVASVMPKATQMFDGVIVQDMFGARMVSVFPEFSHHRQIKIDELADFRITEAKYEGNVLMVVGVNGETGQSNRFVFRFSQDWKTYDVRVIENITPTGLNFTVLDNKLCICITEEERLEIFSSQKDAPSLKSFADPAIKANMRLCHSGTEARFALGDKLYKISVKK